MTFKKCLWYTAIIGGIAMLENLSGLEFASLVVSILIVAFLVIALVVQIYLIVKYRQFNKTPLANGLTSEQTARSLLDANGLDYVKVEKLGFFRRILLFGNHYSVMKKTIYLRSNILNSSSVTAVGIATQKVCQAIQHKNKDKSFLFRYVLQILTMFTPVIFYGAIVLGLAVDLIIGFTGTPTLIGLLVGLAFYILIFVFKIVDIKVEKKANEQTVAILQSANIFNEQEIATLKSLFKLYIIADVIQLVLSLLKIIQTILKLFIKAKSKQ